MIVTKCDCAGCHDDFYNDHNPLGVKECWSLKSAKIVTRWRTGTWTMPATPGAFAEVRVPNCYRQKGYVFQHELPDFAIDPIRLRAVAMTKRGHGGVL
jgi:hypothetical protein